MSAAHLLDLVLAVVLLTHALKGWRVGGIASVAATAGTLLGGGLTLWAAPGLVKRYLTATSSTGQGVMVLVLVLLGATLGEVLFGGIGQRLRVRAERRGLRLLDAASGCVVGLLVTSLVVATLATAIQPALPASLSTAMSRSKVLAGMEDVVPDATENWANGLTRTLGSAGFPRVFSGLTNEPELPVAAPDTAAARTAAVRRAEASIVKVQADATACDQEHEGSGWVVAAHRVVTNAHVVAGSTSLYVQRATSSRHITARVVAFDPKLDLAILDVPGLGAPALRTAGALARGTSTVVAGYPLDGGYTVRAARIRGTVTAAGDDIYGQAGVQREVYSVNATVQPGNSGGPLLTQQGTVAGTVFARSTSSASTGYALTTRATSTMLARAASDTSTAATGSCAVG